MGRKKINFTSFICGQSSTDPANFVKISSVDVEMIGLTEITEIFKKIKHQQNISPPRVGGLTREFRDKPVGECLRLHARTHAQTDGQVEYITPQPPILFTPRGIKIHIG